MNRTTAIMFGAAGVLALSGSALHSVSEPAYYDPSTLMDYLAPKEWDEPLIRHPRRSEMSTVEP